MNEIIPKSPRRAWWRFGFRLRSLFLLTALIACLLGYVMYERRRCEEQMKAEAIYQVTMSQHYSGRFEIDDTIKVRTGVLRTLLGSNDGNKVVRLDLDSHYPEIFKRWMYSLSHLPNLKELRICRSRVEPPGFHYLAAFHKLESLSLIGTSIEDSDLYYLSSLKKLTLLKLNNTNISDAGAAHLATLINLKHLDLHQTKITDASVKYFAKMPNLEYLDLSDTEVSEKSIEALAQHTHLKVLALSPESFSPAARTKIRQLLPKCDIIFAKN